MGTVKYTYVKTKLPGGVTDNPFYNSYITYGKTTGSYDAYYEIYYYFGSAFANFRVEWSTTVKNGRVKSLGFFGDEAWHCWNGNYVDDTCPG
jgi:hypothetical protein